METKPGLGMKQSGWLMSPTLTALECLHAHPHYGRLSIFLEPLSNSSTRQNKVKRKMYALIIFGCSSNQQPSLVHSFFSVNFTCCMYAFLFWGNIWWHPCLTLHLQTIFLLRSETTKAKRFPIGGEFQNETNCSNKSRAEMIRWILIVHSWFGTSNIAVVVRLGQQRISCKRKLSSANSESRWPNKSTRNRNEQHMAFGRQKRPMFRNPYSSL